MRPKSIPEAGDKQRETQVPFILGNALKAQCRRNRAIPLAEFALATFEHIKSLHAADSPQGSGQAKEPAPSQAILLSPRPASLPS